VTGVVTESRLRVRYAETDRMGVAYHTHYLVWCEVGRTDFIRQFGTSYASLEDEGILLAVAEANVRYGASARYDEEIIVRTWLERAQSRAVTFGYDIVSATTPGRRLASASTRLVALDRAGRPRALPSTLLEQFREAVAASPA
jgi:acyl-CoA thioester hydrolase